MFAYEGRSRDERAGCQELDGLSRLSSAELNDVQYRSSLR
jgi:hypothetical protein